MLERPLSNVAYFHAQYRQAYPCPRTEWGEDDKQINLDGRENYIFLEGEGRGHYAGVILNVRLNENGWWGEGDDMIFVDRASSPTLSGTGSEDYFEGAWGFGMPFSYSYFGCLLTRLKTRRTTSLVSDGRCTGSTSWTPYPSPNRPALPWSTDTPTTGPTTGAALPTGIRRSPAGPFPHFQRSTTACLDPFPSRRILFKKNCEILLAPI